MLKVIERFLGAGWRWLLPPLLLAGCCLTTLAVARKPSETGWARRVAAGQTPSLNDYISTGLWWAAVLGLAVAILLLATVRWWGHTRTPATSPAPLRARPPRLFWWQLGIVLVVALVLRIPRMDLSLWGDEEWATRSYVIGSFDKDQAGRLEFKPARAIVTLFGNRRANNHVLHSVAARSSLAVWRAATGAERWAFSERALRLPVLITGLASLVVVAALLAGWGLRGPGILAALLLAVHPWHIRYSTEARGYSFVFLTILLIIAVTGRAMATGKWRWWAALGLLDFLTLASWFGSLYPLAMLQVATGCWIAARWRKDRDATILLWRWLVSGLIALLAAVALLAPSLPQIRHQVSTSGMFRGVMDLAWLREVGSHFLTGMLWRNPEPGNPVIHALRDQWGTSALLWLPLGCLVGVAVAAGVWRVGRTAGWGRAALLAAPVAAPLLAWWHTSSSDLFLHPWYLVYALPSFAMLLVCGVSGGAEAASRRLFPAWRPDRAGAATCTLLIALYVLGVRDHLQSQQRNAVEDLREAARLTRGPVVRKSPNRKKTVIVWRGALLYDPHANTKLQNGGELRALANNCRRRGMDLDVVVGMFSMSNGVLPELMEVLADETLFRRGEVLWGQEEKYTLHLYHLRR